MIYTKKERIEYNEQRKHACERIGITTNQYNWLKRKGADLHKAYENNCNGVYPTENYYNHYVNPLYKLVETYIKKLNLYVYFQTDPRGATIYVSREPIPENNYTSATCIY